MYNGEVFPNNSAILYDFGSNISIHCVTNLRPCCTAPEQGEWYEHNEHDDRNRLERISTYDNGTIAMVPFLYGVSFFNVLHHCILPNATNTIQHIYFGIYNPGKNMIIGYANNINTLLTSL